MRVRLCSACAYVSVCDCVFVCYSVIVTDGRLDGVSMNRLNKASKDKRTDNSRKSVNGQRYPLPLCERVDV